MSKTVEIIGVTPTGIGMDFSGNTFSVGGFEVDSDGIQHKQFAFSVQLTEEQRSQLDAFIQEITNQYLSQEGI